MDDIEAMAALRRGDLAALDVLIERHQDKALRVAYMVSRDRSLAQDAVQDAFVRVYRSSKRFDSSRPFAPWLMRIVLNRAVDLAKLRHREDSLDEARDARLSPSVLRDPALGPVERLEAAESRAEVIAAMRELTPAERLVVVQRYYLGLSDREIAENTGRAVGTVKHLLFRARQRLRTLLTRPSSATPLKGESNDG